MSSTPEIQSHFVCVCISNRAPLLCTTPSLRPFSFLFSFLIQNRYHPNHHLSRHFKSKYFSRVATHRFAAFAYLHMHANAPSQYSCMERHDPQTHSLSLSSYYVVALCCCESNENCRNCIWTDTDTHINTYVIQYNSVCLFVAVIVVVVVDGISISSFGNCILFTILIHKDIVYHIDFLRRIICAPAPLPPAFSIVLHWLQANANVSLL